jgi:hypothetical protein
MSQFEMINDEQALVELSEDQLAEVTGGNNCYHHGSSYSYSSNHQYQNANGGILNGNQISVTILGKSTQNGGNTIIQSQSN